MICTVTAKLSRQENLPQAPKIYRVVWLLGLGVNAFFPAFLTWEITSITSRYRSCRALLTCAQQLDNIKTVMHTREVAELWLKMTKSFIELIQGFLCYIFYSRKTSSCNLLERGKSFLTKNAAIFSMFFPVSCYETTFSLKLTNCHTETCSFIILDFLGIEKK